MITAYVSDDKHSFYDSENLGIASIYDCGPGFANVSATRFFPLLQYIHVQCTLYSITYGIDFQIVGYRTPGPLTTPVSNQNGDELRCTAARASVALQVC